MDVWFERYWWVHLQPAVDVDMTAQTASARYSVPPGWGALRRYREIAVDRTNEAMKPYRPRTTFAMPNFYVTLEATSIMTGKKNTLAGRVGGATLPAGPLPGETAPGDQSLCTGRRRIARSHQPR